VDVGAGEGVVEGAGVADGAGVWVGSGVGDSVGAGDGVEDGSGVEDGVAVDSTGVSSGTTVGDGVPGTGVTNTTSIGPSQAMDRTAMVTPRIAIHAPDNPNPLQRRGLPLSTREPAIRFPELEGVVGTSVSR
jgi:hypothetical protein